MGFFDNLGKKMTDAGQKTVQKTKDMSEVVRMNALITGEEDKLKELYCQIGKMYLDLHKEKYEPEFTELIKAVTNQEQVIQNYKKQIQDIKGVQNCPNCGAEVSLECAFCSFCGKPMPKIEVNTEDFNKCFNCGNLVKKEMRFCTYCGTLMTQAVNTNTSNANLSSQSDTEKICPQCNAKVPDDSEFCTECGTRL